MDINQQQVHWRENGGGGEDEGERGLGKREVGERTVGMKEATQDQNEREMGRV